MRFMNRETQFPGRRKLIKVDENNVPIANEAPMLVRIAMDEGMVFAKGTPVSTESLNKGNWRDDNSLSFAKRSGSDLPDSRANETQIVTLPDGETWIIPPEGSIRNRIRIADSAGTSVTVGHEIRNEIFFDSDPQAQITEAMNVLNAVRFAADAAQDTADGKSAVRVGDSGSGADLYFRSDPQEQIDGKANSSDLVRHAADGMRHFTDTDRTRLNNAATIDAVYPVGSIYISAAGTNPRDLFGMGIWERFGNGRTLVGVSESDADFGVPQRTGGTKTHILTVDQMPNHTHTLLTENGLGLEVGTSSPDGGNNYSFQDSLQQGPAYQITHTGGSQGHNNLQPFITVYMWKRVE